MAAYSDTVIEHFQNPRNAGEIEHPDGEATKSNPVCGDRMRVTIRIADGRVAEVRWQTRGCPPPSPRARSPARWCAAGRSKRWNP
ncbi:MAG: iron-sulfur cluster assembly scaffold protein [Dehalococcoidia bacterium]|nr:iron-sulfur cluster assembly scaffold protein [Dehalococcoidia bacterium]